MGAQGPCGAVGDAGFVEDVHAGNQARMAFCRFLASIYLHELTDEQLESLAHLQFEDDGSPLSSGYAMMVEYLRHRDRATAQELRVDYAHTFLGAGVYDHVLAPPYESVFTSKGQLLMQDSRDKAVAYYRSEGLDLPSDNTTPEDHLGFELQFVACLIERSDKALRESDGARFEDLVLKQRGFLKYHQENWLPAFCDAIDEHCQTDFYRGVAQLTRGYLLCEREVLDRLADALGLCADAPEVRPPWLLCEEEGQS